MNEFIELAKILDDAGYEITEFSNDYYGNRGINLRIVRVKAPKTVEPPSESS